MSRSKGEPKKVVTHIHRTLVSERDDRGKPRKKEYNYGQKENIKLTLMGGTEKAWRTSKGLSSETIAT